MATSKCVKCDGTRFETKEQEPSGSKFKLIFVQCSSCGGVVGVTDYFNAPALLYKLAKQLNVNIDEPS